MSTWSDVLEADLSWREEEIGSLKLLAAKEVQESVRQRALLRALWCLMYAHYEGFFKFAWDFYLESIQRLEVQRRDAIIELARFSLKKEFKSLRGNLSDTNLWACLSSEFSTWMDERLTFETRLETESNLWPSVARANNQSVALPHAEIDSNESRLKALVSRRNDIAHGKPMVIKRLEEYEPYEESALLAMHEVAVAVLNSLEEQSYLISNHGGTI